MRVTRACMPLLRKAKHGHIVNSIGSIMPASETYKGGQGRLHGDQACGARAMSRTMRLELNGEPIRVTAKIAPGMVETEFSTVRFAGATARRRRPLLPRE